MKKLAKVDKATMNGNQLKPQYESLFILIIITTLLASIIMIHGK